MNKYFTLLFSVFLMTGIQVQGQDFESATNAVKNMVLAGTWVIPLMPTTARYKVWIPRPIGDSPSQDRN